VPAASAGYDAVAARSGADSAAYAGSSVSNNQKQHLQAAPAKLAVPDAAAGCQSKHAVAIGLAAPVADPQQQGQASQSDTNVRSVTGWQYLVPHLSAERSTLA
jgi:hypothetical protein